MAPGTGLKGQRRKRIFDVALVLLFTPLWGLLFLIVAACVLAVEGRPVFYVSRRIGQDGRVFPLWKFRTMRPAGKAADVGVTSGVKSARISRFQQALRRGRFDELPQFFNVLRGEMSLVGPRPPDPRHAHAFQEAYHPVLRAKPGLTGLATLRVFAAEEDSLQLCQTPQDAEDFYRKTCLPRKLRHDRLYLRFMRRKAPVRLDLWILWASFVAVAGRFVRTGITQLKHGNRIRPGFRKIVRILS